MRKLVWLLLAATLSSCAHQPAHTTQAPPVVARNDIAAPADAKAGGSAAAQAAAGSSSAQPDADQDVLEQGYKPVVKNGETYYCRKEILTGSRFSTVVCLTPQQIENMKQAAKDTLTGSPMGCGNSSGCFGKGR
jgi:hypothetical protein